MEGIRVSRVLHGAKTSGDFAAVVEIQNGKQWAIALPAAQLDDLCRLLLAAQSDREGQVLSFEVPKDWKAGMTVASVKLEQLPAPGYDLLDGTLYCFLDSGDGRRVRIAMSHAKAVEWRDMLNDAISKFVKARSH